MLHKMVQPFVASHHIVLSGIALEKLAPTSGKRYLTYSHREYYFPFVVLVSFCDLIQPPRSRPISLSLSEIN